jgi:hypothetical protein
MVDGARFIAISILAPDGPSASPHDSIVPPQPGRAGPFLDYEKIALRRNRKWFHLKAIRSRLVLQDSFAARSQNLSALTDPEWQAKSWTFLSLPWWPA